MKRNIKNGQSFTYSIFSGNKLNQKDIQHILNYVDAVKNDAKPNEAYKNNLLGCSVVAQQYVENARKAGKSTEELVSGLKDIPKTASAAELSMKALSIVGNVIVSIAVIKGIELIGTAIDNYTNRIKYAQERLDEFSNTVSESKKNLSTQEKWIKEHGKRYEELSQGIDDYGHIISLTVDEISEYNSLTKDIESMFPTMISGYNDQNNAIIKMKGSVDALTESYKENVDTAYATILSKSSETFGDYKTSIEDAIVSKDAIESFIGTEKITGHLKENRDLSFVTGDVRYDFSEILGKDIYYELVDEVKQRKYHVPGVVGRYDFNFSDLSTGLQQKIKATLTTANATIKTETAKVRPILESFVYGNSGKDSGFDELNEEGKQTIRNVIARLDDTFYEQFSSDSDMASYFYSNFINPLKDGLDKTDLAVRINTLFSLNQNDFKSYQEYVNSINNIMNQLKGEKDSEGNPLYSEKQIAGLQNALGIGKINTSGQLSGQSLIDTVKNKYSSIDKADKFIETLNEKELRVLYNLKPEESKNLDNLKHAIQSLNDESSKQSNELTFSTTPTFSQAWKAIGKSGDEEADKKALEAKESLLELAEAGKLTEEAFSKSTIAEDFLDHTKLSAKEATQEINGLVSSASQLAAMKTGISSISSILEKKEENLSSKKTRKKGIGSDTFDGIPEDVKKQTKEYERFVKVLSDGSSGMDKCKEAANKLATAYVNSENFLANLTDEEKESYTSMLEEMGVENAKGVVIQSLIAKEDKKTISKINSKTATYDLTTATEQEIAELSNYITSLDDSGTALGYYTLQQQIANNNALDTSGSIENLKSLAKQCGITGEAISIMTSLASDMKTVEYYTTGDGKNDQNAGSIISSANHEIKGNKERLNKIIKKGIKISSPKVTSKNPSNPKDNTKDDNPTSDKAKSTQQIDWISRALDRLSSKLDLVKAKYDNLFTNKKAKNSDSLLNLRNKNLDKQYKLLQKTEKYQEKAQKKYTGKANSIKLDASLKKAVREGRIKGSMKQLIATYGEKKAEKIQTYQDWYDKSQEQKKNWIGTKTAKRENRIQKYQNLVDNAEEKRSLVQAQKENAATAKTKNDLIHKESKHLEASYDYQIRIARLEKDSLKVAQLQAQKKKELRDLEIERHQNLSDEYQGELDYYSAQKENLKTADKKNSLIESEKSATQSLYNEKIAIAKLEGDSAEALQLQAELTKTLLDLDIEQHQNLADEHQMTLDKLGAEKELAVKAADKNSLIEQEKAVTSQIYAEKIAIAHLKGKTDEELQLQYEQKKAILDLEVEQHQNLADEHQSNLDMLSAQKENFKTASDKNDVVDKEKNLTVQLYNEKIAIAKLEENTSEQLKLQAELAKQLVQLEKEKLDNIAEYYKNLRKINENQAKNLGSSLDELEARGLIATRSLYAEQKKLNDEKKKNYEEELTLLERQHDNIEKDTQEWYDSLDSIQECKDQIAGCVKTAIELGGAVRNINWQIFEKMSSRLDLLSSEYELAIKLMSDKKLTDDGSFTKEGTATLGAYYSELILAQKKTKESWETLSDMKRHIDRGDDGYTDQKALDEYDEKYRNHIDLVGAEYDIQQKLVDLMKQKYQAELDYLQDIINKRKELLQAEKDAYDYQKTIDEKTKNIGVLYKQISALNSDESEDAKARIQKLWVSLDEANKDLQNTEYSQWISDQQKMLDNLYNEYSDFMDDKLNDTDALLSEAVTYLGDIDVGTSVSQSLEEYYEKYGYDPTDDFNDVKTELGESGSIAKAVGSAADRIIQSSENRHQDQSKADDVSKSISEIGNVYEDSKAIERYREAKKAYDGLATGGADGDDIRKYVSESAKSELDTKGKEVDSILNSVSEFQQYVASIGSLDDRSGYTDTNRQLLAHAYELYENLPASAKELVGDHKYILDYKQSQYDYHGNAIQEEQRIAAEQAAAAQIAAQEEAAAARDQFMIKIMNTYLADGRTYAQMSDEGVIDGELDSMLKKYNLFRSDGYSMSEAGAAAIMNQLGYSRPEQQTREYMVRYMKQIGFSNGGIAQTLQEVPGINGDDGWVTLKKGEGILTPEQTPEFLKLVHNLDTLNPAVDLVKNLPQKAFAAAPSHTLSQSTGDIHIDMNFPNVTNYEEFRRQMQSDPKIEKMFKSMIWDKGDLSKYKITM